MVLKIKYVVFQSHFTSTALYNFSKFEQFTPLNYCKTFCFTYISDISASPPTPDSPLAFQHFVPPPETGSAIQKPTGSTIVQITGSATPPPQEEHDSCYMLHESTSDEEPPIKKVAKRKPKLYNGGVPRSTYLTTGDTRFSFSCTLHQKVHHNPLVKFREIKEG